MGYRLRFDGVNDYCQFGSSMSINLGVDAYTFEVKLILNAAPSVLGGLLGRNGTSSGFFITPTRTLAMYVTGTLRYQTAANFFLQDGNVHTYRLEHDAGGAWRAYRDGTLFGSGTFTSSTTAAPLIWIGQGNNASNSFCSMDLEYLEVTGVTNAQKWDANLSGGTGTTLPTTSGTNQATLINFPTDNSQWQGFSSGTAYADTLQAGAYTSAGSALAATQGYSSQLGGASFTSDGGQLSSLLGFNSTLDGANYTSSGGELTSVRGYGDTLTGGSYNYSGGLLISTFSGAAQSYIDTLLGGSYTSLGASLTSNRDYVSQLSGGSYTSAGGSLSAFYGYSSTLNGGNYTSAGNRLISTWSGEVTVTIEGYTIRFADDQISARFHADDVSATFDNDNVSVTWRH